MNASTPLAPHLTAFLHQRLAVERDASEHTRDTYSYAFQLLLRFASERLSTRPSALTLEVLDAPLVLSFLEALETKRGNGASTRNARLAAIKSFMRFVEHRVPACLVQVQRVLAIPLKRTVTKLVPYLTREEMQAVLDSVPTDGRWGLRDRAMLFVAAELGLRVSELVGLQLADIRHSPRMCLLVRGKGRRERILPLRTQGAAAVRAWLAVRGEVPTTDLFTNARGGPMTRAGFEYILEKAAGVAGSNCPSLAAKRVSPHVLRHTCAMATLQATGDLVKVALWLGHSSTSTTEAYVRADPTDKLEMVEAGLPYSLKRGSFRPPDKLLAMLKAAPATPPSSP